jgi:hypothetical protein
MNRTLATATVVGALTLVLPATASAGVLSKARATATAETYALRAAERGGYESYGAECETRETPWRFECWAEIEGEGGHGYYRYFDVVESLFSQHVRLENFTPWYSY